MEQEGGSDNLHEVWAVGHQVAVKPSLIGRLLTPLVVNVRLLTDCCHTLDIEITGSYLV